MHAYEIPNLKFSLPAGGAVAINRFVSVNSSSAGIQATASTRIIGASMNSATVGKVLEVADGIVMVEAAGNIAAGALVSSDADGKVIPAVADAQSGTTPFAVTPGTIVAGIAITGSSAAGTLVAVKIRA